MPGAAMTRRQLELLWHGVGKQMCWAAVHGGDQELLDLLRDESDRLFMTIADDRSASTREHHDQIARPTPNEGMIAPSGAK
jgi:hypothetical protein